ncbi:MAG: hypothetical protein A2020_01930 [Lentisphaerae bacterium GWF2_45_14]|nr:MAG: hypothetical protein A2020_01930 [Lentisphaerae bacterium GWF2_45_14]
MTSRLNQKFIPGRNPLLELCPFCGEAAELKEEKSGIIAECSNPECVFRPKSSKHFDSEELAIKAWNTRKGGANNAKASLID